MPLERPGGGQLVAFTQQMTDPRWLGAVGHVNGLKHSFVCPGGCDKLSANLMVEATVRTQAMDPGRILREYRGASVVWEGILQEGVPTPQGWQLSAIGVGNQGTNYVANYTSMWPSNQPDESINNALGRGLRWTNPGVGWNAWKGAQGSSSSPGGGVTLATTTVVGAGSFQANWIVGFLGSSSGTPAAADNNNFQLFQNGSVIATATVDAVDNGLELFIQTPVPVTVAVGDTLSVKTVGAATSSVNYYAMIPPEGVWLGQQVDPAAQTITDLMNLCCTYGALTWYVATNRYANTLQVFPLPTKPNRLLIAKTPVARTIGGGGAGPVTTVFERFEISADTTTMSGTANVAQYGTTFSIDQPSATKYGPLEAFIDLSQAGVMPVGAAQQVGTNMLQRFLRTSFAGPFTIGPNDYLTMGGQPVDLACEQAGTVAQLMLTDYAYGGEVSLLPPIVFLVGGFEYDDDTLTASVTPFQYLPSSFQNLLEAASTMLPSAFSDS